MNRAKRVAIALALIGFPVLTGCGSASSTNPPLGSIPGQNTPGYYGNGTCVPLEQAASFTVMNANWNPVYSASGSRVISAGSGPQSVGASQVIIGSGAIPPMTGSGISAQLTNAGTTSSAYFNLSMNVSAAQQVYPTQNGYPQQSYTDQIGMPAYPTPVNIQGQLQLTPNVANGIRQMVYNGQIQIPGYQQGYQQQYNPYYGGTMPQIQTPTMPICISGMSFSGSVPIYQRGIYMTNMAIYLNNTQHGYAW